MVVILFNCMIEIQVNVHVEYIYSIQVLRVYSMFSGTNGKFYVLQVLMVYLVITQ